MPCIQKYIYLVYPSPEKLFSLDLMYNSLCYLKTKCTASEDIISIVWDCYRENLYSLSPLNGKLFIKHAFFALLFV